MGLIKHGKLSELVPESQEVLLKHRSPRSHSSEISYVSSIFMLPTCEVDLYFELVHAERPQDTELFAWLLLNLGLVPESHLFVQESSPSS